MGCYTDQTQTPPHAPYTPTINTNLNHDHTFAQSLSKGIKLEFSRFVWENPIGWLRHAEKCFAPTETPIEKRVKFAEVFFMGKADHRLRSSKLNTDNPSWSEFVVLISNRFAAETTYE
jgi:hypothetical protein